MVPLEVLGSAAIERHTVDAVASGHMFAPVSVIIPCFECADTIGRAVASVHAQSLMPAELILVDDASTDHTWQVLQELAASHSGWVKLVKLTRNQGAASARNAGWDMASQPYIAFLDSDDSWHPEKIKIQHAYMALNPGVAISGHTYSWFGDCKNKNATSLEYSVTPIAKTSLLFRSALSTPSVMLKRELPLRFLANQRYAEDAFLWQQIAFAGYSMVRLEISLAVLHKAPYGAGGLSAHIWRSECAELKNYIRLYKAGCINLSHYIAASLFSVMKFWKRCAKLCVIKLVKAW